MNTRSGDTRSDIVRALANMPAALFLSWSDTKARYKRSMLGPFWLTLGTAIGVGGLGFVWSTLFKMDKAQFIPLLTVGLILWGFIAGIITESSQVFIQNAQLIRNVQLPMFFHPLKLILRHLINLAHNAVVIVIVFLIYPPEWHWSACLALPAFLLTVLNLSWMSLFIGMFAARYRDTETAIANFMPLLFFMSPVLFKAEQLGVGSWVIWVNPFSYFITAVRDPLLGHTSPWFVWPVLLGMTVIGWLVTLWLFHARRTRIPYWI
ncbi:ABC transporter permease [Halothiobacillus sp.]|uniref:ABC transporter permease n=1 Tax=Halothiobacillus sp. TaxID=1891311 RepID=UPI002627A60C|nr:ABC transporter permease [Halothiobacillus sp.]